MPFSALYALITLLSTSVIFVISLRKRGLKTALLLSAVVLVAFVATFFVFLTLGLNNM